MSFLKELFEKRKDKKYGKGHKLGSTPTEHQSVASAASSNQRPMSSRGQPSEASQMAGQAALLRLQQQQNPVRPKTAANQLAKEMRESLDIKDKEYEKAIELKNHYFGDKKVVIDSNPLVQKIYFRSDILGPDVRYSKDEIENQIEQALINQLDQEPILVSVSLLFTANYKNQEKLNKCVEIMNKFVDNILSKPNEEKYRKIRVENPIFKEKVYLCKYSDLVLKKAGFLAKSLKKQPQEPQGDLNQSVEIIENEYEDYFIYEESNFEKLESLKLALSLGEPIIPELDRDIKCFKITENTNLADFQLDDEFYNLSIEELRREQKLRNEALEKAGMLRTKAMRERDEQLELRRYNYCLIRVKFPNNFILQGLFKSNETYQQLYNFVQECLEYDSIPFELFNAVLNKKSLTSNDVTLAELRLAPASVLNFKWNESLDSNHLRQLSNSNFIRQDILRNSTTF